MNISLENKKIYKTEFEDRVRYSTRISKKDVNGEYQNAFVELKFKKGTEPEKNTFINGKGFLSFYIDKNEKPVFYIVVNEFDSVAKEKNEFADSSIKTEGNGIEITDEDLPF